MPNGDVLGVLVKARLGENIWVRKGRDDNIKRFTESFCRELIRGMLSKFVVEL